MTLTTPAPTAPAVGGRPGTAGSAAPAVPPVPTGAVPLARALGAGLRAALARDPKALVMGEDVGRLGGVFRVTDGLQEEFGPRRVVDTPLAEAGIVGTAIGMALRGYRPVCEIQFDGFVWPGFDQILNQLANLHYRSRGALRVPVVVRIPFGGGIGAIEHHSTSPENYFAAVPGLRVISPATASDAYWMIQEAVASDDPVVFFEPKRLYWAKGEIEPEADYRPALGPEPARVLRSGDDVTLVSYGPRVSTLLEAADAAAADAVSCEVVDLRSVAPLDVDTVVASVRRTGRLVVVHESPTTLGIGAELAARVQEEAFYSLEAPVLRVAGWDVPYPPARIEKHYLPSADRVLAAVERALDA